MRPSRSVWEKKLPLAIDRLWLSATVPSTAFQASGLAAAKDWAPHLRGCARAALTCSSTFCPSACQSPCRALSNGRASTMRQSRSARLTPISTNCGSRTIWQKLSCSAVMAACASRGPDRLIACTLSSGYAEAVSEPCKSTGPLADRTRRGSLASGGNSSEAVPAQRCGWLR
ncbi:hypothetical protein D9M71_634940 [compost metagenome]